MANMMKGTTEQKAMAQDAMNRWWWPSLMMFGPHDSESPHTSDAMRWKIKRQGNDELRQKFIDKTVQQAEVIGLRVPDDQLKWNDATEHYEHGPINWNEFYRVINGDGQCNKQRMAHHKKVHNDGAWVREAAEAYRVKKEKQLFNDKTL
jgi:ring-1,2-phenylacetyl-CoA epoxidase subunit PaaA